MTSPKSILIVDDEDPVRLSLSYILQKANYRVDTATTAAEALGGLKLHE